MILKELSGVGVDLIGSCVRQLKICNPDTVQDLAQRLGTDFEMMDWGISCTYQTLWKCWA